MSNIYKQKAEKYKYKYLKLKQELYGGNKCTYNLPILFNKNELNVDKDNIPNKLNIKTDFLTNDKKFYIFNKKGYIGRIYEYNEYDDIISKLNLFKNIPNINQDYIDIVYACTIHKCNDKEIGIFSNNFKNCKIVINRFYGYIISSSKSLRNFNNYNNIQNYLKLIDNFKYAVTNFIIPLHNAGYVLNNINLDNIYWDEDKNKIYFNILKMTENTNKYIDINGLSCSIFYFLYEQKLITDLLLKIFCNNNSMTIDYLLLKLKN
jgi:hypothetical protein